MYIATSNQSQTSDIVIGSTVSLKNDYILDDQAEQQFFSNKIIPALEFHSNVLNKLKIGFGYNRFFANFNAFSLNKFKINLYSSLGGYLLIDYWTGYDIFSGVLIGWDILDKQLKLNMTSGLIGGYNYTYRTTILFGAIESPFSISYNRSTLGFFLPVTYSISYYGLNFYIGVDIPIWENTYLERQIDYIAQKNTTKEDFFNGHNLNFTITAAYTFVRNKNHYSNDH